MAVLKSLKHISEQAVDGYHFTLVLHHIIYICLSQFTLYEYYKQTIRIVALIHT